MTVVKVADFYQELRKYPIEMGMVPKSWITEIFNKIQYEETTMTNDNMDMDAATAKILKPCPFCDTKNEMWEKDAYEANVAVIYGTLYSDRRADDANFAHYYIKCFHCGARTGLYWTKKEAIETWNRLKRN